MNDLAKKEINAAVLPVVGALALAGGLALIVLGARGRKEAKDTGPVFLVQPKARRPAGSAQAKVLR